MAGDGQSGDADSVAAEYFNGSVEYSDYRVDRLIVEPFSDSASADARVQSWRDGFDSRRLEVTAWSALGDGDAVRVSYSSSGLKSTLFVYRVGPVVVISRATAADTSSNASVEAEALRLAQIESDRISRALTGKFLEQIPFVTSPSVLDPAYLPLPAEALGEGWFIRDIEASGSTQQPPRSVINAYGNETSYSARRSAFLRVMLAPDLTAGPRWSMTFGSAPRSSVYRFVQAMRRRTNYRSRPGI